mmetsp:Transcript_1938/g.3519  ORF Transcript_1938/g.3519 Transcript_1938/m.3519 type:complete len:200 (+) Transcript_1938:69-668(+)|eukprot:CAMPEP_0196723930 /NCGR_PEP_ID=MMETSP1091-20130531/5970_1 /TAXON_ID=302021 /ORGANISM="Rhodomonas sp., Strain CCMP768" /LENGTH=199 /DNA_ID=CAMNT_0042065983 /DNA_START=86 /DNA_END=685 /DNA_ORIENTATION=+
MRSGSFALATLSCVALLACATISHAQEEDPSDKWEQRGDLVFQTMDSGNCDDYQVVEGDEVWITHAGHTVEDQVQFDGNGVEPLKFTLGGGTVLRGMEVGMEGMCVGETRVLLIPPHLAFDDPTKRFSRKPVKAGSTVRYQITLVDMIRPGSLRYWRTKLWTEVGIPGVVAGLVLVWALYAVYQSYRKTAAKRPKRKNL